MVWREVISGSRIPVSLLGEYSSTGVNIEETVWLPNTTLPVLSKGWGTAGFGLAVPVAVDTGSAGATVASVTPDWLGAPHIITNSSKQYLWFWDHYAFGDNGPNQNPSGLGTYSYNLRLPGQYNDAETNNNYSYFRDAYAPTLGRFYQSDPAGFAGTNPQNRSPYLYTNNNPLIYIDPFGLKLYPNYTMGPLQQGDAWYDPNLTAEWPDWAMSTYRDPTVGPAGQSANIETATVNKQCLINGGSKNGMNELERWLVEHGGKQLGYEPVISFIDTFEIPPQLSIPYSAITCVNDCTTYSVPPPVYVPGYTYPQGRWGWSP